MNFPFIAFDLRVSESQKKQFSQVQCLSNGGFSRDWSFSKKQGVHYYNFFLPFWSLAEIENKPTEKE